MFQEYSALGTMKLQPLVGHQGTRILFQIICSSVTALLEGSHRLATKRCFISQMPLQASTSIPRSGRNPKILRIKSDLSSTSSGNIRKSLFRNSVINDKYMKFFCMQSIFINEMKEQSLINGFISIIKFTLKINKQINKMETKKKKSQRSLLRDRQVIIVSTHHQRAFTGAHQLVW